MVGPISVILLDTYVRRKKNETDELYNASKSYHRNIKLKLEFDLTKFLDKEIIRSNSKITTQVYNKMKKLPVHCTSKMPVRYKHNAIIAELLRAKKIASNLDIEIKCIVNKYTGAGLSSKFVRSIMNNFDSGKDNLTVCNAKTRLNEHKEKKKNLNQLRI